MCADKFKKSKDYERTRTSFDELDVEEQAVFIVESAVNMIVHSVQKAGDAFSKAFEDVKQRAEGADEDDAEDDDSKTTEKKKGKASGKKGSRSKSKKSEEKDSDEGDE